MNYNSTPSYKHWSKNYRQKNKKSKNKNENLNFRSRILKENDGENEFVGKVTKKYFKEEKKDKEGNVVKDEFIYRILVSPLYMINDNNKATYIGHSWIEQNSKDLMYQYQGKIIKFSAGRLKYDRKKPGSRTVEKKYTVHNISNIEECLDYRLIEGVNFSKDEITNQNCNLKRSERRGAVSNFEIIKAYERGIL